MGLRERFETLLHDARRTEEIATAQLSNGALVRDNETKELALQTLGEGREKLMEAFDVLFG